MVADSDCFNIASPAEICRATVARLAKLSLCFNQASFSFPGFVYKLEFRVAHCPPPRSCQLLMHSPTLLTSLPCCSTILFMALSRARVCASVLIDSPKSMDGLNFFPPCGCGVSSLKLPFGALDTAFIFIPEPSSIGWGFTTGLPSLMVYLLGSLQHSLT